MIMARRAVDCSFRNTGELRPYLLKRDFKNKKPGHTGPKNKGPLASMMTRKFIVHNSVDYCTLIEGLLWQSSRVSRRNYYGVGLMFNRRGSVFNTILGVLSVPVAKQKPAIGGTRGLLQDKGSRRYDRSSDILSTYCYATDQPDASHLNTVCSLWSSTAVSSMIHGTNTVWL